MAKFQLDISGTSAMALHNAVLNCGLFVTPKTVMIGEEPRKSIIGCPVKNIVGIKVGDFRRMRSGMVLRLDPTKLSPSTLSELLRVLS
jgi:hypothetical protein